MAKTAVCFVILALFLSACEPSVYYAAVHSDAAFEQERAFLTSLFEKDENITALEFQIKQDESPASIIISFINYWENELDNDDLIILSRKYLVPQNDPLSGRTNTDFTACINGTETLVPIEEIAPPFTALRVDGLAIGDEGYPLVKLTGIQISAAEGVKITKRLEGKIQELTIALENITSVLMVSAPEPLWISCGGDLMLDSAGVEKFLREGPRAVFGETAELLASSDLALVNLEGVISRRNIKVPKSFNFRFNPEIAPALRAAGIDAVLHANNHVFDYGQEAFLESLLYLKEAGIGIAGAGNNIEEASAPFVFNKGDETVCVFGLASFPRERNGWDGVTAAALANRPGMLHAQRGGADKIKEKFSQDGLNIVLFHGGVEMSTRPNASTRELYTDLIAAGADLVIGSHPHTIQGFEWVLGKPVFWSLGNYVFTGKENMDGYEEGLFIRLGFLNGRLLYMEPFALTLTHTGSDIAAPEALEVFYRRSRELAR